MLLLALACSAPDPDGDTSSADTATPDTSDTATTDTDTTAEPLPGEVANYVVLGFTTADRDEGFDVDVDGDVDNALWALGGMLDPLVADSLAVAMHVVIEQVSGVDDWTDDDDIRVGVLTAEDPDGDGADNASGDASFSGGTQIDDDGRVRVATDTSLVGGTFTAELATGALPVGSYELELATGLFVTASIDPAQSTGLLGFGISLDKLEVALAAEGFSSDVLDALEALADLDLDGDAEPDALSAAFHFDAVACTVTP